LKKGVLNDFWEFRPAQFTNVTNGVTPRRFLVLSNPALAELITRRIGEGWVKNLDELRKLEPLAEDTKFRREWREIKQHNKRELAALIQERTGIEVDPDSLFDIQVKRVHEYKRQHLNILHIISLYNRLKQNPKAKAPPRTFIFGGKAAPGYYMAKLIIKLINAVGDVINNDPEARERLRVVFFPNFSVKTAQRIYPAADLSEQISTAGKEASGTGNMKFALNGALTIGTLDGANVEIREQVGADNFFLFGLTAPEVQALKASGYRPWDYSEGNERLHEVLDQIHSGFFSPDNRDLFRPLVQSLLCHDEFLVLADYQAYIDCQDRAGRAYLDVERWTKMSILNAARIGYFSSDRAIREYCEEIWKVEPVPIELQQ